ncbi:CorA family divalent cation transporter, partial [Oceanispirochaeta sp.]|uniref:CorA family divalent cation transporter n=1 Tax=Oceanispirochaeta sp. TaxID=2035350 RepID=UPI002602F4C1
MARFLKKKTDSLGKSPGDLIFVGDKKMDEPSIKMIDFDTDQLQEQEIQKIEECLSCKDNDTVSWININGLHDLDLIRQVGEGFNLHTLTLEDILNTGQRPKMEDYDDYLFFALKMMSYDEKKGIVNSEHLSIIMGGCFLLTFQERPGDVFDPVRERIRKQKGRVRKSGIDYLAYSLMDTIIDNYIHIIERLGEQIEDIEVEILDNPGKS